MFEQLSDTERLQLQLDADNRRAIKQDASDRHYNREYVKRCWPETVARIDALRAKNDTGELPDYMAIIASKLKEKK